MHSNKAVWVQGALLVAVLAAIGITLAIRLHRPFDRDTLAIQVAQLQSNAAEGQLLVDKAHADRLAPGFVRQHAQQMAEKVATTNDKLQKPSQAALAKQKAQAQALGAALEQALLSLGQEGRPPQVSDFGHLADALDALGKQLKPGDS